MSSENEPSYLKVHYLLRPAKNVQRKMLCQAFQRLCLAKPARAVQDYQYVGFGSMYFGDFVLLHKHLGIQTMTSIEYAKGADRATFNRPFNCITVLGGKANAKLAEIDWESRPAIVWLDYDGGLHSEMLNDLAIVGSNVLANSIIIVTLDATEKALKELPEDLEDRIDLEEFDNASLVGKLNLKCGTSLPEETDLTGGNIAAEYRVLVNQAINGSINSINMDQPEVGYSQVFNFRYSDGRDMMTLGGIIAARSPDGVTDISHFRLDDFEFFAPDEKTFEIQAPKLTMREIRELNRALPTDDLEAVDVPISLEDKQLYYKIYRYFPLFTEAEL